MTCFILLSWLLHGIFDWHRDCRTAHFLSKVIQMLTSLFSWKESAKWILDNIWDCWYKKGLDVEKSIFGYGKGTFRDFCLTPEGGFKISRKNRDVLCLSPLKSWKSSIFAIFHQKSLFLAENDVFCSKFRIFDPSYFKIGRKFYAHRKIRR